MAAKITNIADAVKCAAKMRAGKRCTMEEMRSTALLLDSALRTARAGARQARSQIKFLKGFVKRD